MQPTFLLPKKSLMQQRLKSGLLATFILVFVCTPILTQRKSLWSDVAETQIRVAQGVRTIVPRVYRTLALNPIWLRCSLLCLLVSNLQ